jgi:putative colanic acid biosynthesis UDP-glucose lipid carrier transferase
MNTDTARLIDTNNIVRPPLRRQAPLPPVRKAPDTLYVRRGKRLLDLVISSLLILLLLSWVVPLLFVLIRLGSKGPLFFIQERTGFMGKPFFCIKFRTMRLSRERETQHAGGDEGRITRIGWVLRITHIDELPQLINVLFNDMSLVGPRPHMLYHDMVFSALLPQYQNRHIVKPGITGLAQAAGYHGTASDFFCISNRTRLDLFYVQRVSMMLDLRILLKTLFVVPAKCFNRFYVGADRSK